MWKWEVENPKAVIVMVHGASEYHGRYKWLIEMWRSEQINVVMGDLPGQGTTRRKQRGHIDSFDEYIETIEGWVREAMKYELPVFLLGHSMGGLAVIRTLQEKKLPIKAVILSSPCVAIVKPPSKALDFVSKGLNVMIPSLRFNSQLEPGIATRNEDVKKMDDNDPLFVRKVSVRWYRELVKAMKFANELTEKMPNVPYLVMQGEDDKIVDRVSVKKWFDMLPVSEKSFKEFDKLYHEIFNEPERDDVFYYAKSFVTMQLKELE
ncbi:alpha/beta hydrolase [Bacillus solimangrovi]|uniref:Phospholipase n=1 Tax=Bacillus solimangrovi TaxID=1305675 RepID=A0A1E5LDF8_9BACI|nr:alpha/beta hydrolase [Bacillus solimangrovi]OEH92116.1 phospholipase [Bacillus solimangrovi]